MASFKNLSTLATKAKEVVEKRGGTDSLKEDAAQLRTIAKGPGSLTDKAKAAAEALKRPGDEKTAKTDPAERAGKAPASAGAKGGTKPAKAKPNAKAAKNSA